MPDNPPDDGAGGSFRSRELDPDLGVSSERVAHRDDAALRISAPGSLPVASLPWPLLMRDRLTTKLESRDSYRWWVLAASLSGMFSVTITITILALSIPRIADEFGARESVATWIVAGPILAFAIVGPTLGKAADIWGHRRVFLISLSLASVVALATAAAPTMGWLIFLRILGAVVGAGIGPAAMALINSVFPPDRRVQALGYWSLVAAGAPVIGILAGGIVVEQYGWRWIFIAQAPVTLLAVFFAALVLPTTPRRHGAKFDIPGVLTLGVGSIALLLAISLGQTWGWTSPRLLALVAVVPIMAVAFFKIEQRQPDPLIRTEYLRRPNFRYPILTQFFANGTYMGGFIQTAFLLQSLYGFNEAKAGLLVIPRPLSFAIAGPIIGFVALRLGERVIAVVGTAAVALSMFVMAWASLQESLFLVVVSLVLAGAGLGSASPALSTCVANAVDDEDLGVAGATQQMVAQLGVAIGIQILQVVQDAGSPAIPASCVDPCRDPGYLNDLGSAFASTYFVGGLLGLIGVVLAVRIRRSIYRVPVET